MKDKGPEYHTSSGKIKWLLGGGTAPWETDLSRDNLNLRKKSIWRLLINLREMFMNEISKKILIIFQNPVRS